MERKTIAAILSLILPGLGQAYAGDWRRGGFLAFMTIAIDYGLLFLLKWWILIPFWHAFVIYDAYKTAIENEKEQPQASLTT